MAFRGEELKQAERWYASKLVTQRAREAAPLGRVEGGNVPGDSEVELNDGGLGGLKQD